MIEARLPNANNANAQLNTKFKTHFASGFAIDVELNLPSKGITIVFGPSGSGKTTLIRCIAGLVKSESGYLKVNNEVWQDDDSFLKPHQREVGYVFQEASLFPHLSVSQNIEYGLKRALKKVHVSASTAYRESPEYQKIIAMLGIEKLLDRRPQKLSGGERQRVAIARALLNKPKLLLMDEPLASLDEHLKEQILPYLEELPKITNIPIIYVTHSMREVARLADHVVVMQKGKVQSTGSFNQVFAMEQNADSSGIHLRDIATVLQGTFTERESDWQLLKFEFQGGHFWLSDSGESLNKQYRVRIPAKDISISLCDENQSSILNRLPAKVIAVQSYENSANCLVRLKLITPSSGTTLVAQITRKSAHEMGLAPDMSVWAQIKSVSLLR